MSAQKKVFFGLIVLSIIVLIVSALLIRKPSTPTAAPVKTSIIVAPSDVKPNESFIISIEITNIGSEDLSGLVMEVKDPGIFNKIEPLLGKTEGNTYIWDDKLEIGSPNEFSLLVNSSRPGVYQPELLIRSKDRELEYKPIIGRFRVQEPVDLSI